MQKASSDSAFFSVATILSLLILSGTAVALVNFSFVPLVDGDEYYYAGGGCKAKILVTKNAVPNALQDFDFTTDIPGCAAFTLDDDIGTPGGDATFLTTKFCEGLDPGTYTITEVGPPAPWVLSAQTCAITPGTGPDSGTSGVVAAGNSMVVTLKDCDTVECLFTNTDPNVPEFSFTTVLLALVLAGAGILVFRRYR